MELPLDRLIGTPFFPYDNRQEILEKKYYMENTRDPRAQIKARGHAYLFAPAIAGGKPHKNNGYVRSFRRCHGRWDATRVIGGGIGHASNACEGHMLGPLALGCTKRAVLFDHVVLAVVIREHGLAGIGMWTCGSWM